MKKITYIWMAAPLLFVALLLGSAPAIHAQTSTSSTTSPMISSVTVVPAADGTSAVISWMTDMNADSSISFGPNSNYSSTTPAGSTLTTNHSVTISGLMPSTTYHFRVISTSASGTPAMSADQSFTTAPTTSTSTSVSGGTSGSMNLGGMQDELRQLQAELDTIQQRIRALLGMGASLQSSTVMTPSYMTTPANPRIIPDSATVTANSNSIVDFNGRDFGHEEDVIVTMNGDRVARAHADLGGNFTTGSMRIPTAPGTYIYTFTGVNSGISLTSTITVQ